MDRGYVESSVRTWPPMQTSAGRELLINCMMPLLEGTRPKQRRMSRLPIEWQTHDLNMTMVVDEDGATTFSRVDGRLWDFATGKELITRGRVVWVSMRCG